MRDTDAGEDAAIGRNPVEAPSRRAVIQGLVALPLAGASLVSGARAPEDEPVEKPQKGPGPGGRSKGRAVVVGAGAFGGWTALALRRLGWDVTLLDAWGPGNSRASSGGDTRVIRGMYGPDRIYTDWVRRSFTIWKESAEAWGRDLYHPTGALWLFQGDDGYARSSLPYLEEAGFVVEAIAPADAARRWPQISFEGVRSTYYEREAGYLTARDACRAVAETLVREGGELRRARVAPPGEEGPGLSRVRLEDGSSLEADRFVFACGPWLGEMFPEAVGEGILPTRQEVFYFGPPPAPTPYDEGSHPVWIDFGERIFYGIPGNLHRGFKVAEDDHGEVVDPTTQDRRPSSDWLERARAAMERRFPGMAGAPLLEARVCQYENSPDGHYVLDRHPTLENVWVAGGGSGHGYKLGPAVGEHMAGLVEGSEEPIERFAIERLSRLAPDPAKSQLGTKGEGEGR